MLAVLYFIMYPLLPHAELKHSLNLPINAWGVSWASQVWRIRACPMVPQCVRKMLWCLSRRCFSRLTSETKAIERVDGRFSLLSAQTHTDLYVILLCFFAMIHAKNKGFSLFRCFLLENKTLINPAMLTVAPHFLCLAAYRKCILFVNRSATKTKLCSIWLALAAQHVLKRVISCNAIKELSLSICLI